MFELHSPSLIHFRLKIWIVILFISTLVVSQQAFAQDYKTAEISKEAETQAKQDVLLFRQAVTITEKQDTALTVLFRFKNIVLAKSSSSNKGRKVVINRFRNGIDRLLTEEQKNQLNKHPELMKKLKLDLQE